MKQFILSVIRIFDKTAYICVNCDKIKSGSGARIGTGWACSSKCYEEAVTAYDRLWSNMAKTAFIKMSREQGDIR